MKLNSKVDGVAKYLPTSKKLTIELRQNEKIRSNACLIEIQSKQSISSCDKIVQMLK